MESIEILINTASKIKNFINIITKFEGDFDLASGRYVVDAKSIMGVFSMDFSRPLKLNMYCEDNIKEEVKQSLAEFICSRTNS